MYWYLYCTMYRHTEKNRNQLKVNQCHSLSSKLLDYIIINISIFLIDIGYFLSIADYKCEYRCHTLKNIDCVRRRRTEGSGNRDI